MTRRRALFLDRDGTLVRARHFPRSWTELELFPGVGQRLAALKGAGYRLVVITNQSGLALGYFDETDLATMHEFLRASLAADGAVLDAIYVCPHHPEGTRSDLRLDCRCRKPRPELLLRAANDLHLDLSASWMIGDILYDVEAGKRAGCRTVLVANGGETEWLPGPFRTPDLIAPSTVAALDALLAQEQGAVTYGDYTNRETV